MHVFDRDTILQNQGDGEFRITISDGWAINNAANGGYVMALMAQSMAPTSATDADWTNGESLNAAIVTANYMGRCLHRPAHIRVETMGESLHYIRKEARLIQDGKERIRALGTFVKPSDAQFNTVYEKEPEAVAPWEDCIRVPAIDGYSLFNQIDLRLDPVSAGWMQGDLSTVSVMKGWVEFKDERPIDLAAITLFADAFPPCVLASHGMVAWVPTIEYSVNVRALPTSFRLKGIFTTRFISEGFVEEDGELWDESGTLIALSRQIAKFHPPKN